MFDKYDKSKLYLVACSGGPDSMALLDMLYKNDFDIKVCHVNYKTRDNSDNEQKLVENYCKNHNIDCYVKIFDGNWNKGSFEDIARKFRYNFFKEIYDIVGASGVFVAHHKDDQIETYLLKKRRNVINESYLIHDDAIINNMHIYRPFLDIYYKEDLLSYCKNNNIEYGIDITNFQNIHQRNIIRNEIKNENKEKIYNEALIEENSLINKRNEVKEFIKYYPLYTISMLSDKDDIFILMFLHEIADNKYKKYINFSYVNTIKEYINSSKTSIKRNVHDNYYLTKKYDVISFEYINNEPFSYVFDKLEYVTTKHFKLQDTGLKMQGIYVDDADFPITIRSYKKDDFIKLKEGTKKVSRLFIDKKVPLDDRITYPVIENKNHEIIFVYRLYRKYGFKYIKNNLFVIQ